MNNQKENSVSLITSSRSPLTYLEYLFTYDCHFPSENCMKESENEKKLSNNRLGWDSGWGEEKLGTAK